PPANVRPTGSGLRSHRTVPDLARSGVCDADGPNAVQVTRFSGPMTGTPRWSPDGRRIVFDARPGGNTNIYGVGADGLAARRLTHQPGEDARPAWSADGRWIYFSSDRSGSQQIWRLGAGRQQGRPDHEKRRLFSRPYKRRPVALLPGYRQCLRTAAKDP